MELQIRPDVFTAPSGQGIHFDQVEFLVPLDQPGVCPCGRLVSPDPGDPGRVLAENTSERFDFSELTALIRLAGPQHGAVLGGLLFLSGMVIMAYNMFLTMAGGKAVDAPVLAPAAAH